jgi:ABC-2 type transport system ATP-binding protein
MLTTLLDATSGKAEIDGLDISKDKKAVRSLIGYVPDNVQLYDNLTAYENLEFFAKLSGVKKPQDRILDTLNFLNASAYKDKRVNQLSKGMRQRIGLAQAIIHQPKILFLDEPASGLDPMGIKELRDTINALNSRTGMTIFMNTHLLSEVSKTCRTIGVLSHGRLIYKDSLENTMQYVGDETQLESVYMNLEAAK